MVPSVIVEKATMACNHEKEHKQLCHGPTISRQQIVIQGIYLIQHIIISKGNSWVENISCLPGRFSF